MLAYRLTVLGPPELRSPTGDPVGVRTRKNLALLIYLAVEPPVAHPRDRLATLLWPGSDLDDARHSLSTAVCLLRSRLGPDSFDTTRDRIRLVPGIVVTDIQELERDQPGDVDAAALGAFLEDFDIDDANDFQQWKDGQRARVLPLLHAVLAQRIEHCRRHGDSPRMEALAQRLLRVDDLSEEATRAQLEARALAGDRIGALRLYDRWRVRLADELGAIPSPSLDRMADRLRRNNWEHPSAVMPMQVVTEHWKGQAFVGRRTEFSACYTVWERVLGGEPRHLLLRGETGVGKTTLVERFATAVALEGASVARIKCYELEKELPFGAIGGLVAQLLDLPGASATAPEHLAELGRLVAKVRQRYPALPAPAPSVGETSRLLFTEAVMALIASVGDEHPVVLVMDDIHLSDATSLAVLHLLLRRIDQVPVMVVLTSSSALHAETAAALKFVENAESIGLTQVHIDPMPEHDAGELLDTLVAAGPDPGPTLRRALLAGARGNPMVLELLIFDWRRRGDDCLALSLGSMTTTTHTPPEEAFRRVVDHTLVALDPESRSVAELGAILGQRLNDLSMYTLVDLPVARTMRAMTSLAGQRILRDAGNTLEFTNDFVRGQCYLAMAAPLRRMLHGAVADRLLGLEGVEEETVSGLEVAWHLVRADRLNEAVPYLLTGGKEAIRRAAPHEADLALSTGLPALVGEARRSAILLLAEAQQELGRWADSLQLLSMADEPFSSSEQSAREAFLIIAKRRLGMYCPAEVHSATGMLLRIANSDADIEVRVKALAAIPPMLNVTRDEGHIASLDRSLGEIRHLHMDSFQYLHILHTRAWVRSIQRSTSAALQDITEAVAIAEEAAVASSIAVRLLIGKGGILAGMGRYAEALPSLEKAERLANRLDNMLLQGECACGLSLIHGRLGSSSLQIIWARRALQSFPQTAWSTFMLGATYELGLGLAAEQSYQEAQATVSPLFKKVSDVPPWLVQEGLLFAADVLAISGNLRKAYSAAKKATTGPLTPLLQPACAGQFSRWVALLGLRNQEPEVARARLFASFPHPELLDTKDQAELLAALTLLEMKLGVDASQRWREVRQRLSALPTTVTTVMRRISVTAGTSTSLFDSTD